MTNPSRFARTVSRSISSSVLPRSDWMDSSSSSWVSICALERHHRYDCDRPEVAQLDFGDLFFALQVRQANLQVGILQFDNRVVDLDGVTRCFRITVHSIRPGVPA